MKAAMLALLVLVTFVPGVTEAQEPTAWDPLPDSAWEVRPDSAAGDVSAIMLFEKIVADEKNLDDEKCYVSVYCRILIFNHEGREWADVHVEYNPDEESIDRIAGRTVLRDGRTLDLDPASVLDKEIVRTEEAEWHEKFFVLPGVEDTCIVEYKYRKRSTIPNTVWIAQKSVPVKDWEYRWRFYDPNLSAYELLLRELYFAGVTPNYFWANSTKGIDIVMLPNSEEPEEAIFRINDLPPFDDEPYTLPDEALKANLRLYYTNNMGANEYWSYLSDLIGAGYAKFLDKGDDVRPVVDSIAALPSGVDRATAAFDWVKKNIRLIAYGGNNDKYERNESVNDVLERRYGDEEDVTLLFHRIMKDLPGYTPLLAVASDRSTRVVYKNAKYWQFDGFVVGVSDSTRAFRYYAPGVEGTMAGQLPWYYEGATALVAGAEPGRALFIELPKSDFAENKRARTVSVTFTGEGTARVDVREVLMGQFARRVRALVADIPPEETERILERDISDRISEEWRGEITDIVMEARGDTVVLRYAFTGPGLSAGGAHSVVKPLSFLPESINPFVAVNRKHPITFEYAQTMIDTLLLDTRTMTVESKPPTVWVSNRSGSYEFRAEDIPDGLRLSSRSILKSAMYSTNVYEQVKPIVGGMASLRNVEVVLSPQPPGK